jgi:hypothetical protein
MEQDFKDFGNAVLDLMDNEKEASVHKMAYILVAAAVDRMYRVGFPTEAIKQILKEAIKAGIHTGVNFKEGE